MILSVILFARAHSLLKGPYTFKYTYDFDRVPTKIRRNEMTWKEPWAAEAASQCAMWLQVNSIDFPALRWGTLGENVLAHYNPNIHEIVLNLLFETAYSNEPLVLRLVLLHELLHAFKFGDGNLSLAEISWKRDFSTDMPTVENYHWNVDAQGYHFRSSRPANSELMQPVLNSFTFLSMASLYATEKNVRYACDRNEDCEKGQKCVFDSISWVGTCEHVSKQDSGSDTVLAIALVLAAIVGGVTAVIIHGFSMSF